MDAYRHIATSLTRLIRHGSLEKCLGRGWKKTKSSCKKKGPEKKRVKKKAKKNTYAPTKISSCTSTFSLIGEKKNHAS